ncbi:MAG TPA: O-antigen ligase family protein [Baekduia sp.]|nr:O-antigen ligase family protein [Baekduia sp.]
MLATDAGGYFAPTYLRVGSMVLAVVGLLLLVAPPYWRPSGAALGALGCLVLYAGVSWLSVLWSEDVPAGIAAAQRNVLYVGLFALGLLAAGSGRHAHVVLRGILVVATVVLGAGVIARVLPGELRESAYDQAVSLYRLSYPLTYFNAYGALAAFTAVLAVGVSAQRRTPAGIRALAASAGVVAVIGLHLSFSRGAWLAAAIAVLALVVLAPHRGLVLVSLLTVGVAAAIAIGILESEPALVVDPALEEGQEEAGEQVAPALLALVVMAGAARYATIMAVRRMPRRHRPALSPGAKATAAGLALVLLLGAASVAGDGPDRLITGTADEIERQWDDFLGVSFNTERGSARLATARSSRSDVYRVAIDAGSANPLHGTGGGTFAIEYARERDVAQELVNAHSLYLETFAEQGLLGLVPLLGFVGLLGAAVLRGRGRAAGLGRTEAAAVGAACVVWLVHAGVDWDWQVPALTGTMLVLAATVFPPRAARGSRTGSRTAGLPKGPVLRLHSTRRRG